MKIPPSLQKGDTIGIVSTARKISKSELQPALDMLTDWELNWVLGASIGAEADQFAGDDLLRANDFQMMLDNPQIKAIWCARGGYGSVRIIDQLDFTFFKNNPKWIIGYSDVTVLHSHIHKLGVASLHAQMCLEFENKTEDTRETLRQALFGNSYTIACPSQHPLNRNGQTTGELVGGNLSILYSLCGSPSALDTKDKILFLEDLDEHLYHIDRMMQNLKRNGMLKDLKGLIVGAMSDMKDHTIAHGFASNRPFGKTAEEIIHDVVKAYNYPVVFNFPGGHILDNRALLFGQQAEFSVAEDKIKLKF